MSTTKVTTAGRVAAAFNRQGSWTARPVEHDMAVEIRNVDDGSYASTVWLPESGVAHWAWTTSTDHCQLPPSAGIADLVEAVTKSLLEKP